MDQHGRTRGRIGRTALGAALALVTACATAGSFRERNRDNLARLSPGMTREQVFEIMGTETVRASGTEEGPLDTERDTAGVVQVQIPVGGRRPVLRNPHRNEVWVSPDGTRWEVLFYYTRMVEDDGRVTEDELTPVVLRDGLVAGTGWRFWNTTAEDERIRPLEEETDGGG